jgi:phosphomannomutase / phosphoglucomutase
MFPIPEPSLPPDGFARETRPLVKPAGFREYDVRWLLGEEINLMGVEALGMGLGTLLGELGAPREVVTGHDFRAYSAAVKLALTTGLMAAGCRVHDIGLALTPMAYFAQFALDIPAVAMVTASHNENGWTGVKMGADRPLTFGPEEIGRLKEIVLGGRFKLGGGGGTYRFVPGVAERYVADLTEGRRLNRRLKVVAACGNGTAGAFAPKTLEAIGCEVVPLNCELDHAFPNHNPNPEDLTMLGALSAKVAEVGADLGLAFDGDGDRCGFVDEEGEAIFADKVGLLLARHLSEAHPGARFVVDVKATGLFASDPVLSANGAATEYWKTGHSYIKRRVKETGALAGFEKSGHFFFGPPVGRGYDDGLLAAIAACEMLDRAGGRSLSQLVRGLPRTWSSPTMSPHCADEAKYGVVEGVVRRLEAMQAKGERLAGQPITELNMVNGARAMVEDGSWGLVRASSNKPELVVVVESPVSEARMREMFQALDALLRACPDVGAYNQTI